MANIHHASICVASKKTHLVTVLLADHGIPKQKKERNNVEKEQKHIQDHQANKKWKHDRKNANHKKRKMWHLQHANI